MAKDIKKNSVSLEKELRTKYNDLSKDVKKNYDKVSLKVINIIEECERKVKGFNKVFDFFDIDMRKSYEKLLDSMNTKLESFKALEKNIGKYETEFITLNTQMNSNIKTSVELQKKYKTKNLNYDDMITRIDKFLDKQAGYGIKIYEKKWEDITIDMIGLFETKLYPAIKKDVENKIYNQVVKGLNDKYIATFKRMIDGQLNALWTDFVLRCHTVDLSTILQPSIEKIVDKKMTMLNILFRS